MKATLLYNSMRNKWTKEEVKILETNWETKLVSELEELLPGRSRDAILSKMKHTGLRLTEDELCRRMKLGRSLVVKDNFKTDLSLSISDLDNVTLQVLLGSMLGDGCCNKQSENLKHHRFCECHSMAQHDYLEWKSKVFSVFKPRFYVRPKWQRVDLITLTHPIFDLMRAKFYISDESRKSIIPIDVAKKLDLFGFLIWYLDDGHLGHTNHRMEICVKGWQKSELVNLSDTLNQKFGLSTYVYSCKGSQDLKIPAKDKNILVTWRELALKHKIPECMMYKLKNKDQNNFN